MLRVRARPMQRLWAEGATVLCVHGVRSTEHGNTATICVLSAAVSPQLQI
jgi:hypothetical protein